MLVNSRKFNRVGKVRDFGATYGSRFPKGSAGGRIFEDVARAANVLADVAGFWTAAATATAESRDRRLRARQTLRETFEAIERTAKAIALDNPGVDVKLSPIPAVGDTRLLASARGVLENVTPFAPMLVELGMSADFPRAFGAQITALEQAIAEQAARQQTMIAASNRVRQELERVDRAAISLNAIIRNTLSSDAEALAAWNRAWRLPRPRRKTAPETGPVPASVPETSSLAA